MSHIVTEHVKGIFEMQKDLLGDGELPVPYSEVDYYQEMLECGYEEDCDLARLVAAKAVPIAHALAQQAGIHTGKALFQGDWVKIAISDKAGIVRANVCYHKDCYNSQQVVLMALSVKYEKVIWL